MSFALNTLSPALGSKKLRTRVGRGAGSKGKTCGRGHKGQRSRSGVSRAKLTSGQNPLHMQIPKSGFKVIKKGHAKIALRSLNVLPEDVSEVTVATLIEAGIIKRYVSEVRIYLCGEVSRSFNLKGIKVTKGARLAIESVKGKVED